MLLNVAIVGAPHGLKGEVKLNVRTDAPERRFVVGTMFETEPADVGPVTLASVRNYKGSTFVTFAEYADRTGAEAMRGVKLVIETDEDDVEEDAWFAHELIGLEALDPDGYELGEVAGLEPGPAHDYLIVREPDGIMTRVPFVKAIVTEVDVDDHCVVIDAPRGLFSEDEIVEDGEIA